MEEMQEQLSRWWQEQTGLLKFSFSSFRVAQWLSVCRGASPWYWTGPMAVSGPQSLPAAPVRAAVVATSYKGWTHCCSLPSSFAVLPEEHYKELWVETAASGDCRAEHWPKCCSRSKVAGGTGTGMGLWHGRHPQLWHWWLPWPSRCSLLSI